jgi:hypothetical protein
MHIILTCLNNFQDYILDNIHQLIQLGHNSIYVITNSHFFSNFDNYLSQINLIDVDLLNEEYHFYENTTLNKDFRNGFWALTSFRFFYISAFMQKYNIDDVIHLENDVLIYYNCDTLKNYFDKNHIYLPFDTFSRNIASIMYIPNVDIFKNILDNYDFTKNDMENFYYIKKKIGFIKTLPIFIKNKHLSNEQNFVSENSDIFPFIFDAAAIGQYLGGVDPKNINGNTKGFINETCVIKYNNYKIWLDHETNKPFILIEDKVIPIFNLHIHSKNLQPFLLSREEK